MTRVIIFILNISEYIFKYIHYVRKSERSLDLAYTYFLHQIVKLNSQIFTKDYKITKFSNYNDIII